MDQREAAEYLEKQGLWNKDRAEELQEVVDLVGDRFEWLLDFAKGAASGSSTVEGQSAIFMHCTTLLPSVSMRF